MTSSYPSVPILDHGYIRCYDADTEVLTRSGFKRWAFVNPEDELGQWDESAQSLVYEKPIELQKHFHSGLMYRVDHGGVDLLVRKTTAPIQPVQPQSTAMINGLTTKTGSLCGDHNHG